MFQDSDPKEARVTRVRLTLDDWKEVLVAGKRVLDWEQPYHPGVIFGGVTLYFLVVFCWLEPSMTTLLSLTLLKLTIADYLMPFVAPKIFPMENWGSRQEHEFNVICEAIVNARKDVEETVQSKLSRDYAYGVVSPSVMIEYKKCKNARFLPCPPDPRRYCRLNPRYLILWDVEFS